MTLFGRKDMWNADWAEQERLRLEEAALRAHRRTQEEMGTAHLAGDRTPGTISRIVSRLRRAFGR